MVDDSDLRQLQETLSDIESTAQSLEGKHNTLASEVRIQSQRANANFTNDRKALAEQLRLTGQSITKTIEAANTTSSHQPLLSFSGYIFSVNDAPTTKDNLSTACSSLIGNFDKLAKLVDEANEELSAIHRAALQTEDEIAILSKELKEFESEFEDLQEPEEELEGAIAKLQELEEAQDNTQRELKDCRWQQAMYEEERRHQKKVC